MKIEKTLWAVFLFLALLSFRQPAPPQYEKEAERAPLKSFKQMMDTRIAYIQQQPFCTALLEEYMDLIAMPHKKIAYYQAVLETSYFQSLVFIENNNLFGMKQAFVRPNTAVGTNRGHAVYNHWTCSVNDYKLRYVYFSRHRTYTDYLAFLVETGYAEDMHYINKLITMKQN